MSERGAGSPSAVGGRGPAAPARSAREVAIETYLTKLRDMMRLERDIKQQSLKTVEARKREEEAKAKWNSISATGQPIGEIYGEAGAGRYLVRNDHGTRRVVRARARIDRSELKMGARITLDQATHTIMHVLPMELQASIYHMMHEDPGDVKYSDIGGLGEQINEIREVVELPLVQPQLFERVGVPAPKGCLFYGPPGCGKTLIARAIACSTKATFLKAVGTNLIGTYIGESAKLVKDMFQYARDHQPALIFIDEIDALAQRRLGEGAHSDRDWQRTLMELLAQMDGFSSTSQVKMIMATNRPDVLDPALLRPGRLDRKIEIALPNEQGRHEILRLHSRKLSMEGEIDWETVVKLSDGFNGADLRNICTEAGLYALRAERDAVINEDFMKAVRQIRQAKTLESTLHYDKI